MNNVLGIDIGGSGIKGAPVDIEAGKLLEDRLRIETPQPATPKAVAKIILQLVEHFNWRGKPVGCAFPAIVKKGVILSAAHIDKSWLGIDAQKLFEDETSSNFVVLNDADAAGIAEISHGAGKDVLGTVLLLTFGTGIGSALFVQGILMPNTELGHLDMDKHKDVEKWAAARIRKEKNLSWKKWGKRVNTYLNYVDMLLAPDLIIIGGGVSRKSEEFFEFLKVKTKVVPAQSLNEAGIIGAATAAYRNISSS